MIVTALTYLSILVAIFVPLYLLYRLWARRFETLSAWLVDALHVTTALAFLFVVLRWDVVGYPLRYGLYALYLAATWASWLRVRELPFLREGSPAFRGGAVVETVLFTGLVAWIVAGGAPNRESVEAEPPLRGGRYSVVQGGGTPLTNYHGIFADPQAWALDISALNRWGFRATGVNPSEPEKYEIFGDTVYSPLSGTVVRAEDTLPDQRPPETLDGRPAGNQVWIRRDSLYLLLAHLRQGSVGVEVGQRVEAGEPVARVGNTGNTSEPHLHVHAVAFSRGASPEPDSLLVRGTPVPIRFNGRALRRNDTFVGGSPEG